MDRPLTAPDLLALIDARLAELTRLRAQVLDLLGAAPPAPAEESPPGKAWPGTRTANRGLALDLARALLAGPMANAELARATGASDTVTHRALKQRPAWFRKVNTHRMSPWELTEAGRKAAAAAPPPAA